MRRADVARQCLFDEKCHVVGGVVQRPPHPAPRLPRLAYTFPRPRRPSYSSQLKGLPPWHRTFGSYPVWCKRRRAPRGWGVAEGQVRLDIQDGRAVYEVGASHLEHAVDEVYQPHRREREAKGRGAVRRARGQHSAPLAVQSRDAHLCASRATLRVRPHALLQVRVGMKHVYEPHVAELVQALKCGVWDARVQHHPAARHGNQMGLPRRAVAPAKAGVERAQGCERKHAAMR
mmetsp:Transcript_29353/g.73293  ORF Transcript_29353/g.73293 Transcript_29353/m.73293 type:complete len:232 (-) Transcript_29353:363-1058(-)